MVASSEYTFEVLSYYEGLYRYSRDVGLPMLVAWKHKGLWSLFEPKQFKRARVNYTVSLEAAFKQNLLGVLAGDFAIVFRSGAAFHFVARKEERVQATEGNESRQETWQARIEAAYFTNADGDRFTKLEPGLLSLFLTSLVEKQAQITDLHISETYAASPEEPMQWAHATLGTLLSLRSSGENPVRWRQILQQEYSVPTESEALRRAAQDGIDTKIVRYVLDLKPHEWPDFLVSESASVSRG